MFTDKTFNLIFENIEKNFPNSKTELDYVNDYTLLVAVVLSAQSTDLKVNKVTKILFEQASSPEEMLKLGENRLKELIKNIGLYNMKAKNIIMLSDILVKEFNSQVPKVFEDLIRLPGVGRKTANVVLNCLYNLPTIAVDTHVLRVSNRIGFALEKNPHKLEIKLLQYIPLKWIVRAHNLLVLHGRYICKARIPKCLECNIKNFCLYFKNNNKIL